jgi:uncharacterized protein (TIGR02266 family)
LTGRAEQEECQMSESSSRLVDRLRGQPTGGEKNPDRQDRIGEWMTIEMKERDLEQQASQVEQDAAALETRLRSLVLLPEKLQAEQVVLRKAALDIRSRRERILAAREEIRRQRSVFLMRNQLGPDALGQKDMKTETDKRRARVAMSVDISPGSESNFWAGLSQDIDEGGVFVATYDELSIGTCLDMTIRLPNKAPMRTTGTVGWLRTHGPFTDELAPGLGVVFESLSDADRETIDEFMGSHPPLLYEL